MFAAMPHRETYEVRHYKVWDARRMEFTDSLEGQIMWLPPLGELPMHSKIDEGCYGHPVVVLSTQASPSYDVVVLIVTSFRETDVQDKFRYSAELRRAYLPIHPAQNQDTNIQLHLQNGVQLRKKSYTDTRKTHTVPLDCLRPYDRKDRARRYVLTSDSYRTLARHAGFVPDETEFYGVHQTPDTERIRQVLARRYGPIPGYPEDEFPVHRAPSPAPQVYDYYHVPPRAWLYQPTAQSDEPLSWADSSGGGGGDMGSELSGWEGWLVQVVCGILGCGAVLIALYIRLVIWVVTFGAV